MKNSYVFIITFCILSAALITPAYSIELHEIIQKGKAKEYLQKYEEEAKNFEAEGKLKQASKAYLQASRLARAAGNYQKGILLGTKASELSEKTDYSEIQPQAYYEIASSYVAVADYERALPLLEKTALLASGLDMKVLEANAYEKIGIIYRKLDNPQKALEYQKRAFGFYERIVEALKGPEVSPTQEKKRAKRKLKETRFVRNFIEIALSLGNTYTELNDYKSAIEFLDKALFYSSDIKDKLLKSYLGMGDFHFKKGDYSKALEYHKKACELSDNLDIPGLTAAAYAKTARDYQRLRRFDDAVEHYKKAIAAVEDQRSMLQSEEMRSSFFEQMTRTYDGIISALISLGKTEEAFNFSERVRARTFLDILGNKIDLSRGGATALIEEERNLKRKISDLQLKMEETDNTNTKNEIDEIKKEYNRFIEKLRKNDMEHASLVSVEPLTLKDVRSLLTPDQTLVEFHVLRNITVVWVVTKNSVQSEVIRLGKKELADKISSFRKSIESIASDDRSVSVKQKESVQDKTFLSNIETISKDIYSALFNNINIKSGTQLVIVPHDILHYLPFQSLITKESRYLLEDFTISYLSSASLMRFTSEKGNKVKEDVLAFGNPYLGDPVLNLPYAENEVKEIKNIYPKSDIYTGKEATGEKAKKLSDKYSILHFATHGEFNELHPMESSLRLTRTEKDTGRLSAGDIFSLNINAYLVVLSACETALGKINRGDEIIGFTRAFIYAGTPSIITTLWKVNDMTTYMLMSEFYKNLKTMKKADALRAAQLNLMKTYRHPFFWGAFVLNGAPE
ncbi:MAG: hypothetical protein C0415_04155 [Thermodesulfovibrio sp.]|nr:hypothetical protein [Thermodesulfovibrio sp.]